MINMYSTFLKFVILCTITIFNPSVSLTLSIIPYNEAFTTLYGNQNVIPYNNDKSVQISMNQWLTYGSGFISKHAYNHGLFAASIKLPNNSYSAGVVATFYAQNKESKDEIDFEFLGHIKGEEWTLQTNIYGNGSLHRGREERYKLPFDPAKDFHNYSILWNEDRIVFFIDNIAIREVERDSGIGNDFPSTPMFLYGTIWDGSKWATHKGMYQADFQHGAFVTGYSGFIINGCRVDLTRSTPSKCNLTLPNGIPTTERSKMDLYRAQYMTYSYCHDTDRYPAFPECKNESVGMQVEHPQISGATRRFI